MKDWIVTFGGSGKSPVAPGTVGSLATSLIILVVYGVSGASVGDATSVNVALVAGILAASAAAVWLGPWAIEHYGRKDPGSFVLDEVAGVCLTMLGLPLRANWHEWWPVLVGFAAFRLFDVTKPPPCHALEKLPAGWGILMDDLMAAVYANIAAQLVIRLLV
jgi:phosphatidylglycerophosphatase A